MLIPLVALLTASNPPPGHGLAAKTLVIFSLPLAAEFLALWLICRKRPKPD
jgi:hypothetical protein